MKKLFLALALLVIGVFAGNPVAFAMCNNNNQVAGQNGDGFDSIGWCIDGYGALTPHVGRTVNSQYLSTSGAFRVPVAYNATANTTVSFNSQQSGLVMVDSGGVTSDTLTGSGSKFILPACNSGVLSSPATSGQLTTQGMMYTLTVGSKSFATLDTLNLADTFMYSISGTGQAMGDSIKSTGQAGDSVTVVCVPENNNTGVWVVKDMHGVWTNNGTN